MRGMAAIVVLFLSAGSLFAQGKTDPALAVREEDGGSVSVRTANGILNQDSSLKRRWYLIDDVKAPAGLDHAGVFPRWDEKENAQYLVPVGTLSPKGPISAIEVRYLLFDVWGDRLRTLAVTRLVDSSTHVDLRGTRPLPALESEVSQLVTVVAFVARVRTGDGQVWTFDPSRIAPRMAELGLNVALADLTPDEQRIIDPGRIYWVAPGTRGSTAKSPGVRRP